MTYTVVYTTAWVTATRGVLQAKNEAILTQEYSFPVKQGSDFNTRIIVSHDQRVKGTFSKDTRGLIFSPKSEIA